MTFAMKSVLHNGVSTPTTSLSTTQKYTPHINTQQIIPHFPHESLPAQALCFLSPITKHSTQPDKHQDHSHKTLEGFLYCAAPEPTKADFLEMLASS